MKSIYTGRDFTLEVTRDERVVESRGHHELDPAWSYVDPAGHRHSTLDSLAWVVTESSWCDSCRDMHDDEGEYRCRECGATVDPAYVFVGPDRTVVAGLADGRLRMNDGRTFWLRGDDLTIPWAADGPTGEWIERITSREPDEFVVTA